RLAGWGIFQASLLVDGRFVRAVARHAGQGFVLASDHLVVLLVVLDEPSPVRCRCQDSVVGVAVVTLPTAF
ncbi:MAG: hypothetical protein ACP5R2_15120, partial [Anaerolineae bacterium]